MASSEDDLFDERDENELLDQQDQLKQSDLKINREVRKQIDERLEKKTVGSEESDEDYLDHYYDFDDLDDDHS